jgi:anthranilate synthase/aminodeoxychorismate synthase-like glutamine amidotransferase
MPTVVLLDNYDSFTYNLYDYLLQIGTQCVVLRNDATTPAHIATLRPDALVLSPGPCRPAQAGILMQTIEYFHTQIPILGICLGHQAIGEFFGATLTHAALPTHGKTSFCTHTAHAIFRDIPQPFAAMRYHSLILKHLPSTLQATAHTAQNEIMAIAHHTLPICGVQFHPESIGTKNGINILKNWQKYYL